ncbi:DinB family protein [Chloroflexi bacterium TSY]|nr:DinB family protein [Chloroflexi bacterium TSY]
MNTQSSRHDEIIANYGKCPSQLEAALSKLPASNLDIGESAESWTIREIVHHIADGDDLWKSFIKQAIGYSDGEFFFNWYWQAPQDEWVINWNYEARSIEPSLAMFRANRTHIVQLVRHTPGSMEKRLRVRWPTEVGEQAVSVASVLEGQTHHVFEHIAEIGRIREAHGV